MTWMEMVKNDMKLLELEEKMVADRNVWRRRIHVLDRYNFFSVLVHIADPKLLGLRLAGLVLFCFVCFPVFLLYFLLRVHWKCHFHCYFLYCLVFTSDSYFPSSVLEGTDIHHTYAHYFSILSFFNNYAFLCRWGNTPLDEGRMCGNKNLIKLLEDAKSTQLSEFPYCSKEITGIAEPVWPDSNLLNKIRNYLKYKVKGRTCFWTTLFCWKKL